MVFDYSNFAPKLLQKKGYGIQFTSELELKLTLESHIPTIQDSNTNFAYYITSICKAKLRQKER